MRDDSLAAAHIGIEVPVYRLMAFVIAACYAGVGGALYAGLIQYVSPDTFSLGIMFLLLAMVIVGGRDNLHGAALGAVVAVVALVATRPQAPTTPIAVVPKPVPTLASGPLSRPHTHPGQTLARKPVSSHPGDAAVSPRRIILPTVTAELPTAKQPPLLPLPLVDSVPQPRAARHVFPHPGARHLRHIRTPASAPTSHRLVAPANPVPDSVTPNRPDRATNDSTELARTQAAAPGDPPTPASSDSAMQDTTGMTQMASGAGMPASSEKEADDLAELRRRLTDRPLQVPDLGEVKPANSPRSSKDGWIRF
jgi:hypothetical protein